MDDMEWVEVCGIHDIEVEDVIRFDYKDRTYAVYRTDSNAYYATDGWCTHGKVHLSGGLVMNHVIECPKHNGRFDIPTGAALRAPACVGIKTYSVKLEAGRVLIRIPVIGCGGE